MIRRRPLAALHFVWIGAEADPATQEELYRSGLAERVHFIPPVADPFPWFELCDVFTLTSREDPCPLVCLEAAALRTPIVCFDDVGGMTQFAGNGECGLTVPNLNITAMGTAVLRLLDDTALVQRICVAAAARVSAKYDVEAVAPELFEDMRRVASR